VLHILSMFRNISSLVGKNSSVFAGLIGYLAFGPTVSDYYHIWTYAINRLRGGIYVSPHMCGTAERVFRKHQRRTPALTPATHLALTPTTYRWTSSSSRRYHEHATATNSAAASSPHCKWLTAPPFLWDGRSFWSLQSGSQRSA